MARAVGIGQYLIFAAAAGDALVKLLLERLRAWARPKLEFHSLRSAWAEKNRLVSCLYR